MVLPAPAAVPFLNTRWHQHYAGTLRTGAHDVGAIAREAGALLLFNKQAGNTPARGAGCQYRGCTAYGNGFTGEDLRPGAFPTAEHTAVVFAAGRTHPLPVRTQDLR